MRVFKIQVGLRLEPDDAEKISFMARKNKRSFNSQIEFIAQESIKQYEKENGKIKTSSAEQNRHSKL